MPEPIYVTAFKNDGLVPPVECVRCPSCHHEMPLADVQVLAGLDMDAGFSCRCGLRLHLAATADVVVFSADEEVSPAIIKAEAVTDDVAAEPVKRGFFKSSK